mgnify:CR=1 FL=1
MTVSAISVWEMKENLIGDFLFLGVLCRAWHNAPFLQAAVFSKQKTEGDRKQ